MADTERDRRRGKGLRMKKIHFENSYFIHTPTLVLVMEPLCSPRIETINTSSKIYKVTCKSCLRKMRNQLVDAERSLGISEGDRGAGQHEKENRRTM